MDYGKKIFDEKKAKAAAKKKQKQTQVKELKFRPGTEEGIIRSNYATWYVSLKTGTAAKSLFASVGVRWHTRKLV